MDLYGNAHYSTAKRCLFELLHRSGLVHLFRWSQGDSVLVAMYHDVLPLGFPEDNPLFGMTVTVDEFDWQVTFFGKYFSPISFQQFSDWYFHGAKLPRNPVLITFDDGHANNLRYALPVLKRHRVNAVCFVLTGDMGRCQKTWYEDAYFRLMFSSVHSWCLRDGERRPLETFEQRVAACSRFFNLCRTLPELEQRAELASLRGQLPLSSMEEEFQERFTFLSADEVRTLAATGTEIGSHTVSHPILATVGLDRARRELAESKSQLEHAMERTVRPFAYPFGASGFDFQARDEALVRENGYTLAFASQGGFVTRSSNRFALPRVGIGRMTRAQFAATVTGAVDSLKRVFRVNQ